MLVYMVATLLYILLVVENRQTQMLPEPVYQQLSHENEISYIHHPLTAPVFTVADSLHWLSFPHWLLDRRVPLEG